MIRTSVELRAVMFGTTGLSGDLAPTIECEVFVLVFYASQIRAKKPNVMGTDTNDQGKNNIN